MNVTVSTVVVLVLLCVALGFAIKRVFQRSQLVIVEVVIAIVAEIHTESIKTFIDLICMI